MNNSIKISIIIPCYNHGHFLRSAIQSVEGCRAGLVELIIVDDGSTEPDTVALMDELSSSGYNVIRQANAGVGAARNRGIAAARAEYILPLDSDNKIRPEFVERAVKILDGEPDIGIVHSDFHYFGDLDYVVRVPDFDIRRMLFMNFIDACAVFRKKVWEDVGGYDAEMPVQGIEDWDFWITAHSKGWKFRHLNMIGFDYQARKGSMLANLKSEANYRPSLEYLFRKHVLLLKDSYDEVFSWAYHGRLMRRRPLQTLFRLSLNAYFPSLHARIYNR
jgi:glycosyltransferase involved in cell wall biosynthesis